MERACARIADVTLKLKRQYQSLLGASPAYGVDQRMTREMDGLGLLLKELEDSVVILQIKLDESRPAEEAIAEAGVKGTGLAIDRNWVIPVCPGASYDS